MALPVLSDFESYNTLNFRHLGHTGLTDEDIRAVQHQKGFDHELLFLVARGIWEKIDCHIIVSHPELRLRISVRQPNAVGTLHAVKIATMDFEGSHGSMDAKAGTKPLRLETREERSLVPRGVSNPDLVVEWFLDNLHSDPTLDLQHVLLEE